MEVHPSRLRRIDSISAQPRTPLPCSASVSDPPETLLVVDDDPMVRQFEAKFLSRVGYEVLQADGAAEALRLADATAAIHLLITDYSMPEIDGVELTRRFRAVHPKTPVLMVSGSLSQIYESIGDLEHFESLEKPFMPDELLHRVSSLLQAAAPLPIRSR
jgi:DNA-binding response OmpR family regulator